MKIPKSLDDLKFKLNEIYLAKFIFIHINRTGGSSIEKALGLPLRQHKTASEKLAYMGLRRWDKKFKFAFVRNPWDKVVSHYHHRLNTNQSGLADNPINFNQWVKLAYGEQAPEYYDYPEMFTPQIKWISNTSGNIIVDFIGRFENLEGDFKKICQEIGRNIELPHIHKSKHKEYQYYYSDQTREIIRAWFKEDIRIFDYDF